MGFTRTHHEVCSTTCSLPVVVEEKQTLPTFRLLQEQQPQKEHHDTDSDEVLVPQHISKAAAKGDQDTVLEWLGPPPVPANRLDALWRGHTLLHEAVAGNRTELVTTLLELGADVDPRSSSGFTPLEEALLYNCSDRTARLLLTWGATVDPVKVIASENSDLFELIRTPLGGRRCVITGLQKHTEYNGQVGVATKYIPSEDIYVVQIEGNPKAFTIASANLRRQDRTPIHSPLATQNVATKQPSRETFPRIQPRISTSPIEEWGIWQSEFDWEERQDPNDSEIDPNAMNKLNFEAPPRLLPRVLRTGCDESCSSLTPVVSRI